MFHPAILSLLTFPAGLYGHGTVRENFVFHKGELLSHTTTEEAATCWRYTWLGSETEKTNGTSRCSDLEGEDENEDSRPCSSPLVWTDGDFSDNQPDPEDIEAACQQLDPPCRPHCTPGSAERCIKYSEWSGDKVSYSSSFCGQVTLNWTGERPDNDRCYRSNEGTKEYCYRHVDRCYQDKWDQCNSSPSLHVWWGTSLSLLVVLLVCLMA